MLAINCCSAGALFVVAGCTTVTYQPQADRDGIRGVVKAHFGDIEKCYLRAIEDRPGAEGKAVMGWEIAPDGHAQKVHLESAGPKIEGISPCLVRAIEAWKFPPLSDQEVAVTVTYPFFFSENGDYSHP